MRVILLCSGVLKGYKGVHPFTGITLVFFGFLGLGRFFMGATCPYVYIDTVTLSLTYLVN